jgi:hypothetical protein
MVSLCRATHDLTRPPQEKSPWRSRTECCAAVRARRANSLSNWLIIDGRADECRKTRYETNPISKSD